MNKKLKIFLGAYVNFPNAQNVNCDNIARYLDKDKFEVHTMYTDKMPIDKKIYKVKGIHLHRLIHHRYIWWWCKYLTMLFGKYDIYYLPKGEEVDYVFVGKHKKDAVFLSSVEGVVGEQVSGTDPVVQNNYLMMDDVFSISKCIRDSVKNYWDVDTEILYLGVNQINKNEYFSPKKRVKNVIWIGSIIERKRPEYLIECAKKFSQLRFIMIGDGEQQTKITQMIDDYHLCNLRLTGRVPNKKVYQELQNADLLLMTSDKEGLPKVIGEAMISGVPVIYINECYDVDYIKDGINGYAVSNLNEMIEKMQMLLDDPKKYQLMSVNALETIQDYTWKNLIKKYEAYFTEQYQRKRGK